MSKQLHNKPELKFIRNKLRCNLTPAEAFLWKVLQSKQLSGRKFRRQYSIDDCVVDFYCPQERLAVELDGDDHFKGVKNEMDAERDKFLSGLGIRVIRFENKLVFEDVDAVLEQIKSCFRKVK